MIKFSNQSLPSIDFRKAESILLYPSRDPTALEDLKVSGVSTFWRSPYKNEIYSGIAWNASPMVSQRYANPKPLGQVKGILKNSISKDNESDSSGDDIKKLRGILSKKMSEGALRKKSGKRVQFDRLVRLHEISRRHGYTSSGESVTSDEIDDISSSYRQISIKDLKETVSNHDRTMQHVPRVQQLCFEEISSDARPTGGFTVNRCSSAPILNNGKNCSKPINNVINSVKSPENRLLSADCRVSHDGGVGDKDRQTATDVRTARLIRSYTSPVLLSQRSVKKPVLHYQSPSRHESIAFSNTTLKKHLIHSAKTYPQSRIVSQEAAMQHFDLDAVQEVRNRNSNFCNNDKTNQIIRWLKDVNITQAREGRCTVSLPGMNEHRDT